MKAKVSPLPKGHRKKKLKLRFSVMHLDLPERRIGYSSRPEEENMLTMMCQCGPQLDSRTHMVRGCEMYKEKWNVLIEGMAKLDVCDI